MPKSKKNQKNHTITIRVSDEQYYSLKEKADNNHLSISDYARGQLSLSTKTSIDIIALQELTECINPLLTSGKLNTEQKIIIEERMKQLWESLN